MLTEYVTEIREVGTSDVAQSQHCNTSVTHMEEAEVHTAGIIHTLNLKFK